VRALHRQAVRCCLVDDAMTVVEVLRHAKACSREAWGGDEATRPLDDAGWTQTKHLTRALAAPPLSAIYCSPTTRCTQTVEALAATSGIPVTVDERLAGLRGVPVTDNGLAWPAVAWLGARALDLVDEAVAGHRGGRLLLCSHGDVLAALLAAVAGRDRLDLVDVALKKGARVTLRFGHAGRCVGYAQEPPAPKRPRQAA
jgi:8-oxo-(d)GTP phosphatase